MKYTFQFFALFSVLVCNSALGALWQSGHGDIGIGFDGTDWDPHFHFHEEGDEHDHDDEEHKGEEHDDEDDHDDHEGEGDNHPIIDGVEATEEEYEIDALTLLVSGGRLPGAGVADSGAADIYVLAQDEALAVAQGTPWVGSAVEEIASGLLLNDLVTLSLVDVSGPGVFSLWTTDSFGADSVLMSSALGSDAADSVALPLEPGHYHFNMGFSEEGTYEVTFNSSATTTGGVPTGTDFTVQFNVVPEPSSLFLLALGAGAATLRRRRL